MSVFLEALRERRRELTAGRSVKILSDMERFFGADGENWSQFAYHRRGGEKCLVGAMQSMRAWVQLDDVRYWLRRAIAEKHPGQDIEDFNDTRPYSEIAEILARAKQLAAAHVQTAPVAEIPLPPRPALSYQPQERVTIITAADLERVAVKRRE